MSRPSGFRALLLSYTVLPPGTNPWVVFDLGRFGLTWGGLGLMLPTQANTIFLLPRGKDYAYDFGDLKKGKTFEVEHLWVDSLLKVNGKTLWIKPMFTAPSGTLARNKTMTEPFWAVRKVEASDAGVGNMELSTLAISGTHVTLWQGPGDAVAGTDLRQVPVLCNKSDLKQGDELVWAYGEKKKKRKVAVKVDPPAKKLKVDDDDSDH